MSDWWHITTAVMLVLIAMGVWRIRTPDTSALHTIAHAVDLVRYSLMARSSGFPVVRMEPGLREKLEAQATAIAAEEESFRLGAVAILRRDHKDFLEEARERHQEEMMAKLAERMREG